jgi:hypothetical protein
MTLAREPDAGNPPVRFDEREMETEHGVRDLATQGKPGHSEIPPPTPPRHLSTLPMVTSSNSRAVP